MFFFFVFFFFCSCVFCLALLFGKESFVGCFSEEGLYFWFFGERSFVGCF